MAEPTHERVALIAGASGGIGGAVARRLAAAGVRIHAGYCRHAEEAERLAAEIRSSGGSAEAIGLDIAQAAACEAACDRIGAESRRLDILVNCAAITAEEPALGMDDAAWEKVVRTNLDGAFRLCRAAAKHMVVGRWGRIVNVSSIVAARGGRGQIGYAASKAGLEAMTRVLAIELGRKGVTANAVAPGVIETSMSERIRRDHGEALREAIAVHRFGTAEEVAALIAFLASDDGAYITGQVIRVDGGLAL